MPPVSLWVNIERVLGDSWVQR